MIIDLNVKIRLVGKRKEFLLLANYIWYPKSHRKGKNNLLAPTSVEFFNRTSISTFCSFYKQNMQCR